MDRIRKSYRGHWRFQGEGAGAIAPFPLTAKEKYGVDKSSTNLPGWGEGHLCRVADNTVWSHWQVASRSSEVNFTKNYVKM